MGGTIECRRSTDPIAIALEQAKRFQWVYPIVVGAVTGIFSFGIFWGMIRTEIQSLKTEGTETRVELRAMRQALGVATTELSALNATIKAQTHRLNRVEDRIDEAVKANGG